MSFLKKIEAAKKAVKAIPKNFEVQPLKPGQEAKNPKDRCTCGYINRQDTSTSRKMPI